MERNRNRTAQGHGDADVRFTLFVPRDLKRAMDVQATAVGVTGPEMARRLITEGLERIEEEAVWERTARIGPLVRERDRAIVQRMNRIAESWEQSG